MTVTRRATIYTRISRDREGAGLGVERQEDDCRELAGQLGWPVTAVRSDNDVSAYSGKPRPGYAALLEDIREGRTDAVLIWHTDRLHRSPVELEDYITACQPREIPTVTVKAGPLDLSTPSGRLVARQLGSVARYEVEHMVERQQRAKLQKATEGRWKGGRRPYGFEDDGETVRADEAAELLRLARSVLAGASLRGEAAAMNARGLVSSTGAPWRADSVRGVLLRARNAGLMEHQGKVIGPAVWPAVIPEPEWRAIVALLADPDRRKQMSSARRWLGSGLFRCGIHDCPGTIRATLTATGRRVSIPGYVCTAIKHVVRNCSEVDDFVGAVVVERLSRPDAVELLAREQGPDVGVLHQQANALRQRLNGLATLYADGGIDAPQLREGSDRIRAQLASIDAEIAEAGRGSVLGDVIGPGAGAAWAGLGLDRKRAIIDALMVVTLLPSPKGRPPGWKPGESYFRPETVRIEWRAQ